MTDGAASPYAGLTPQCVLDAVAALGMEPDGRLLALNSYENRVYRVGLEGRPPVVAKFYRPGRWSDAAIAEEHAFAAELVDADLPVVAPLAFAGRTLHEHDGLRYALFPTVGGRAPEPGDREGLRLLGRTLARLHAVGRSRPFRHRPTLGLETFGREPVRCLLEGGWLPPHLVVPFEALAAQLLQATEAAWSRAGEVRTLRLHGDCHYGNLLQRGDGILLVDLDDCLTGPAIQDLWMLVSGEGDDLRRQWEWLLEGYGLFAHLEVAEFQLVESLRTLRLLHYHAWIARRWDDPAFPAAFPWFGEPRHWEGVITQLQEQLAALQACAFTP